MFVTPPPPVQARQPAKRHVGNVRYLPSGCTIACRIPSSDPLPPHSRATCLVPIFERKDEVVPPRSIRTFPTFRDFMGRRTEHVVRITKGQVNGL